MSMLSLKLPLCEMNTEKAEIEVGRREGERERMRKGGGSQREGGREGGEKKSEKGRAGGM